MLNLTLKIKIKQRLNKLDSNDYDNIEDWQILEAFNKGQVSWCRRQLVGTNILKQGDEQSKRRIDDLQILLKTLVVPLANQQTYYESVAELPTDYFEFKRVNAKATADCCPDPKEMVIYLTEEANVPLLLRDHLKNPNFEWGETFMTFINNRFRIYTNGQFTLDPVTFYYYRQPTLVQFINVSDPYTGLISTTDVECEFKDDIVEVLIDEAAAIIAGDIESFNQYSRETETAEKNN
jgi:hypothetical protein